MSVEVVNQDSVLKRALDLVDQAKARIWITSPWITQRAVNLLLRDVLPRVHQSLDIRIVYRVKEPGDLDITDLEALKTLEDAGCQVRYSTRLHAKLLLVDDNVAIVSSSNLTATAGYSVDMSSQWRNEELGVLVQDEAEPLAELVDQFEQIWASATSVGPGTVGIVMDFPTVRGFNLVAIRDVRLGSYVTTNNGLGSLAIGQIAEITAYNRSFPHMGEAIWLTQGYPGASDRRGSVEVPDLQSLFSHPSKEQGFLVTKTFFEPESVFRIARVEVLLETRAQLPDDADLDALLQKVADDTRWGGPLRSQLRKLIEIASGRGDLGLDGSGSATVVGADGSPETLDAPGLYVLDLRRTADLESRAAKASV